MSRLRLIPMLEFRVGDVIPAEVLVYTDLNDLLLRRLYADNPGIDDYFKSLSQKIQDFYESCEEECIFVNEAYLGLVVAARYSEDKRWYRAEVCELTSDPNKVKVLFVDYGNREEVELKDLRLLLARFHEYEVQIFRCKLVDIKYKNEKELNKATNFFYETTSEIFEKKLKTLKLTIKKIHGRAYSTKIYERLESTFYEVFIDYPINNKILTENKHIFNLSFPAISVQTNRYLFLVRHGQYFENASENDKKTLTELGQIQADLTGRFLKELHKEFSYMKIISSTMIRAIQTSDYISKYFPELESEKDASLCELHVNNIKEENEQFKKAYERYFRNGPKQRNNESLIIVCHANLIRAFICKILKRPFSEWNLYSLNHGSVTLIEIKNDTFRCIDFNNVDFLPNNQKTFT